MISRRSLLRAAPLLFAAPAIVRVASLMPVKALRLSDIKNRTIWAYVDLAGIRDRNILLRLDDYSGVPVSEYMTGASAWSARLV